MRVEPGTIKIDGLTEDWTTIPRFTLRRYRSTRDYVTWKQVRMAHDGSNLYLLVNMTGEVEKEMQESAGVMGLIYVDADGDPDTGFEEDVVNQKYGFDYGMHIRWGLGRKPREGGEPNIYYMMELCDKKRSELDMENPVHSLDHPDQIAFKGQCVEMKVPFSKLHITPPVQAAISIQPGGAGDHVIYDLKIE